MSYRLLLGILAVTLLCFAQSTLSAQDDDTDSKSDSAEVSSEAEVDGSSGGDDSSGKEPHAGDETDSHAHGSAAHAEHDTDPTHANVSDGLYEVTEFRSDLAFFTAIVFLLLLAGLFFAAWKPIMEGLEKRERRISDNISKAEQDSAAAAAKLSEYEAKLAAANEEAQQIVAEARKDAEATGQKLVAAAQEEAVRQRERASTEIESAKRVALSELAGQSTDVAMSLAQRVVGREIKAEDHQSLIQDMLSKLPSNN